MSCCLPRSGGASSSSKEKPRSKANVERPPKECKGYPPAMLPKLSNEEEEEVDFYIPLADGGRIACSLIKRAGGSTKTYVEEGDFTIDTKKPVIVFCHGSFCWRNQLLVSHLATGVSKALDCHTLRFDFQGNGSSSGDFVFGGGDRDLGNLKSVVSFVQNKMKCKIVGIVAHSKSAHPMFQVAFEQEESQAERIPCFVNLSSRFAERNKFNPERVLKPEQIELLETTGKVFLCQLGDRRCEVTRADVKERDKLESSFVKGIKSSRVMTIHGSNDMTLKVVNAHMFDEAIENHELQIINGADHNFNGLRHMPKLVSLVSEFVRKHGTKK